MTSPGSRMVDVSQKPVVARRAVAEGRLVLEPGTLNAIREGRIEKGNVLEVARVAGIQAAKLTPLVLPLTHPIPLTAAEVQLVVGADHVGAAATVQAEWKTGVEMEALVAVTTALLTVWDMVKSLEKDRRGQYPNARLTDVRVVSKEKGP